ncbi:MAG: hypothetical protein ACI9MC_001634 [Kiritimatiellia bacterium]|jgi:hypothetical protein
MRTSLTLVLISLLGTGCANDADSADPEFSDALAWLYRNFEGTEHEIAFVMRSIEEQLYTTLEMSASDSVKRTQEPRFLEEADLEGLTHPDRDLTLALPVATARLSDWGPDLHSQVVLLTDQRPVEPYSPDVYDRAFSDGADCWQDRGCVALRSDNDITKKNLLMEVNYQMRKDFRWIDLALPAPSEVPDGEQPVNDGEPRWAIVGRSWIEQSAAGDSGKSTIQQSYAVEFTVPRDSRGFRWEDSELTAPEHDAPDSDGAGSIRMQSLWSETTFDGINVGEDMIKSTLRGGMDKIMRVTDEYIEDELVVEE